MRVYACMCVYVQHTCTYTALVYLHVCTCTHICLCSSVLVSDDRGLREQAQVHPRGQDDAELHEVSAAVCPRVQHLKNAGVRGQVCECGKPLGLAFACAVLKREMCSG